MKIAVNNFPDVQLFRKKETAPAQAGTAEAMVGEEVVECTMFSTDSITSVVASMADSES